MNQSEAADPSREGRTPPKTALPSVLAGIFVMVGGAVLLECILYRDLVRLESGKVESIRVYSLQKLAYEWFGFYGALAVIPALIFVAIAMGAYRAWKIQGTSVRTEAIERVEWKAQSIFVTVICSLFGAPFVLAGIALFIMPLLEGIPCRQNGPILPTLASGLGLAWIGLVLWFIAWRNRPWGPHGRRGPQYYTQRD